MGVQANEIAADVGIGIELGPGTSSSSSSSSSGVNSGGGGGDVRGESSIASNVGDGNEHFGVLVNTLKTGDFFGECALLEDAGRRTATIIATGGEVSCFVLNQSSFTRMVSSDVLVRKPYEPPMIYEPATLASHAPPRDTCIF